MTLEDQRLDFLRNQLDDRGLICERKMGDDPDLYRFAVSHDPKIELRFSKEHLEMSSWVFTERVDLAIYTAIEARKNSWGARL